MMLLKAITDSDLNECIKKTNKFIKTLPVGMWYSTQLNPLIQQVETVEKTVTDGNTVTVTRTSRNIHDYTAITYYIGQHEIAPIVPVVEHPKRQNYQG